ncbi:MAG: methyltransferase, TIGR04325 family [Lentisphaeria bacterium]|nr:methyltransferase, TIGR04325 family [Lentisphaeria bacterium]
MSLAPVALFCYNRVDTLRQTVAALQTNEFASASDLFIFADGAKGEADREKVAEVREYISTIDGFKSVTVKVSDTNKGLANSIISGVTEVVDKYGRIIVLEDDIVTAPFFLKWMNSALDLYENEEKIAGVHAWTPPAFFGDRPETYFIREVGCWGWATWKRGWDLFEADGEKLLKQFDSRKKIYDFNVCGSYPYYDMLKNQAAGKADSWAIRWYASVFLKGKFGLQPGKTLVANIGCLSGTHFDSGSEMPSDSISAVAPELRKIDISAAEDINRVYINYNLAAFSPSVSRSLIFCFQTGEIRILKNTLKRKITALRGGVKQIMKKFLPDAVLGYVRKYRKCWGYKKLYSSWQSAASHAGTYDSPEIIRKVLSATQQVIDGKAVYERDSVLFYEKEYNTRLVAALQRAAAEGKGVHVLDFGGALGSVFWQHREILQKNIKDLSWHIVEQKSFFDVSASLNYDAPLYFHETIDDALKNSDINVVLFASVLQYLERPEYFIDKVRGVDFIIVDRHPEFCSLERSLFTVQYVKEPIYNASYPVRIWGHDELIKLLSDDFDVADKWLSDLEDRQVVSSCEYGKQEVHNTGVFFERKNKKRISL